MVFLHIDKKNENKFLSKNKNQSSILDKYIKNGNVFILIYMEGCGPCNMVRPEWNKLKNVLNSYKNNPKVLILDIDKDSVKNINGIESPSSFPTLKFLSKNGKLNENYEDSNIINKDRSIDSFVEWIKSKENNNIQLNKNYKTRKMIGGKWSLKYKKSINCKKPKGFSQKQYCKYSRRKK